MYNRGLETLFVRSLVGIATTMEGLITPTITTKTCHTTYQQILAVLDPEAMEAREFSCNPLFNFFSFVLIYFCFLLGGSGPNPSQGSEDGDTGRMSIQGHSQGAGPDRSQPQKGHAASHPLQSSESNKPDQPQVGLADNNRVGVSNPESSDQVGRLMSAQRALGISDVTLDQLCVLFNPCLDTSSPTQQNSLQQPWRPSTPPLQLHILARTTSAHRSSGLIFFSTLPCLLQNANTNFHYQAIVQSNIKRILLDPTIEQDVQTITGHKHAVKSPVVMMQVGSLTAKPLHSKQQNSPPGYDEKDNAASESVILLIWAHLLKTEKHVLGNCYDVLQLLSGIWNDVDSKSPLTVAIHSLLGLVAQASVLLNLLGLHNNSPKHVCRYYIFNIKLPIVPPGGIRKSDLEPYHYICSSSSTQLALIQSLQY
ncbi:hypothetical protein VP01_758g1 [Puccinia sorghi]|uniref:Uncharacterized protein n=1 Tax=Puccinia sorghi TaxID=27349 RepID=A0A0L6UBX6_9BASI|nr:hypothetical protein VP01_758g1 [Puccinia sorghi]